MEDYVAGNAHHSKLFSRRVPRTLVAHRTHLPCCTLLFFPHWLRHQRFSHVSSSLESPVPVVSEEVHSFPSCSLVIGHESLCNRDFRREERAGDVTGSASLTTVCCNEHMQFVENCAPLAPASYCHRDGRYRAYVAIRYSVQSDPPKRVHKGDPRLS